MNNIGKHQFIDALDDLFLSWNSRILITIGGILLILKFWVLAGYIYCMGIVCFWQWRKAMNLEIERMERLLNAKENANDNN